MDSATSATGEFSITGLFTDGGSASEVFFIDMEDLTIHGVKTLEGAEGTIIIKFQAQLAPDFSEATGHFVILSGTGIYQNLHGVGTTTATIDHGVITATYETRAHFD
jgi:hypothetical protein